MRRANAFGLVLILALAGLAALPGAAAVPVAGTVAFLGLDHQPLADNAVTGDADTTPEIGGTSAVFLVRLTDADLVAQTTATVTVKSVSDPTGEVITLTQEAASSPDFVGTVGVETTIIAGDGLVGVVDGQELFIAYQDAAPAATITSAAGSLEWVATTTGSISLPSVNTYGVPGTTTVTVTDGDRSLSATVADTVQIRVLSVRDLVGILLTATETGVNTGVFTRDITEGPGASTGAQIQALDGDLITAVYYDSFDAAGHRNVQRTANTVWHPGNDAAISFTDSTFRTARAALAPTFGVGPSIAFLRAEDADGVGAGSAVANVKSCVAAPPAACGGGADPAGISVTLAETAGTGEFIGSVGFSTTASSAGILKVAAGNVVVATIADARSVTGLAGAPAPATAVWGAATSGTLRFTQDDQFSAAATSIDATKQAFLELADADLDTSGGLDSATVRVTSSLDPVGMPVTLVETGLSTGLFRGCFAFQNTAGGDGTVPDSLGPLCDDPATTGTLAPATAKSGGKLLVRTGSSVSAVYTDAKTATGGANVPVVAPAPPLSAGTTAAPAGNKGSVAFKTCSAGCSGATPTLVAATGFFGTAAADYGVVEVTDPLLNKNAATVEAFTVYVGSQVAPNQWQSAGTLNPDLSAGPGLALSLTETGANTGIFRGFFGFTTASSTSTLVQVAAITDAVAVSYSYAQETPDAADHVGLGVVQATIPWLNSATAALDFHDHIIGGAHLARAEGAAPVFLALDPAPGSTMDSSEDTSAAADTVNVALTSGADATGITVALHERYSHSPDDARHQTSDHAFLGQFGLSFASSSDATDVLKVLPGGDAVVATYSDPHGSDGRPILRTITLPTVPSVLGVLTTDLPVYRTPAVKIASTLTDSDRNDNAGGVDTALVVVVGDTNTNGINAEIFGMPFAESAANTGVFFSSPTGAAPSTLGFETTSAANSMVLVADGDTVTLYSLDPADASGSAQFLRSTLRYFTDSHGGLLTLDSPSYAGIGTLATITLDDIDANANSGVIDTVKVRVFSDSDGAGEVVTLTETGATSHIFTGTVGFESTRTAGNGKVKIASGETFKAYYFDECASGSCAASHTSAARLVEASWATSVTDTTPPVGTLVVTSSTHAQNTASANRNPVFSWSGLSDPQSAITYRYALNQQASYTLASTDPTTSATTVSFSNVTGGTWYFHIVGISQGGSSASATYTIIITAPTPTPTPSPTPTPTPSLTAAQLLAANKLVKLTVTRSGTTNTLSWTLPNATKLAAAGVPLPILGVQVWSSNSPYTLLKTFPSGSANFASHTYADSGDAAKATTKYLVTMYFGATQALGFFDGSAGHTPDTADYAGTTVAGPVSSSGSTGGSGSSGLPTWAIVLIAIGVLFLVVLVVILVARGRNREAPPAATQAYAWEETTEAQAAGAEWQDPAAGEVHQARCPACSTSFTAMGAKPIVTVCPGCGKKGILR